MSKKESMNICKKQNSQRKNKILDSDQRNSEEWKGSNPKQDGTRVKRKKKKEEEKRGRKEEKKEERISIPFSMLSATTHLLFWSSNKIGNQIREDCI